MCLEERALSTGCGGCFRAECVCVSTVAPYSSVWLQMENYVRVLNKRELEPCAPNELRITSPGRVRMYVASGVELLSTDQSHIVIKAMGQAISKAVAIGGWGVIYW